MTVLTVLSCRHTELFSDEFDEEIANSTLDVEHAIEDCDDCAVFLGDDREVVLAALEVQGKEHQATRARAAMAPQKTIRKKRTKKSKRKR